MVVWNVTYQCAPWTIYLCGLRRYAAGCSFAAPLVVVANVGGGDPAHRALHPVAVAVIQVGVAGRPVHPGQVVFGVPSLRSGQASVKLSVQVMC
jgi:hypothetical protein